MKISQVINWVIILFLFAGIWAYLRGKPLGREFENGIMSCGRLVLCMAGFIVLAPVLANVLSPIFVPLFSRIGVDPSILPGLILANDAGGSALAMEMAVDPVAGQFSGWIVGSMLGTTVMFVFPMAMSSSKQHQKTAVIYGLLCGIATVPVGCLAGGLTAGFPPRLVLYNSLPVIAVSALLLSGLFFMKERIVPIFIVFGHAVTTLCCLGLALGALELIAGVRLIQTMGSLSEAFTIIGSISVFLAGAFPLIAVIRKLCAKGLDKAGALLDVNEAAVSGMLMTLANGIPTFGLLDSMDEKGIVLNLSFMVSASCVFGDHLAYTASTAPELTGAVLIGKLVGGMSALLMALWLFPQFKFDHYKEKRR